jgi:hypothetical protein
MIYSDSLTTEQQESIRANSVNVVDATIERLREVRAARAQSEPAVQPQAPVANDDHRSVEALSSIALSMMRDGYDNMKQDRNGRGLR